MGTSDKQVHKQLTLAEMLKIAQQVQPNQWSRSQTIDTNIERYSANIANLYIILEQSSTKYRVRIESGITNTIKLGESNWFADKELEKLHQLYLVAKKTSDDRQAEHVNSAFDTARQLLR